LEITTVYGDEPPVIVTWREVEAPSHMVAALLVRTDEVGNGFTVTAVLVRVVLVHPVVKFLDSA
jgi:hypothetical protein